MTKKQEAPASENADNGSKLSEKKKHEPLRGTASIHVSLEQPKALRKEVLALAIDTIQLLKHHERLHALRLRKVELREQLRREMDGIRRLVQDINVNDLPLSLEEVRNHPRFKIHEKVEEIPDLPESELLKNTAKKMPHKIRGVEKERELLEETKAENKLESDLDALRRKLAEL